MLAGRSPADLAFVAAARAPAAGLRVRLVSARHASQAASLRARASASIADGASLAAGALAAALAVAVPRRRAGARRTVVLRAVAETEAAPQLLSERDVDYTALRDFLERRDFKAADAETRRLLIVIAGEAAVKRGWIYFAEVRSMPDVDMNTLDSLWAHYSKGKFGFAAQRKIWRQEREQFDKFAEQVSWFTDKWTNRTWPDEFVYSLDAPVGHLPLTNCIRGAQVLQEIMCHSAFDKKKKAVPKQAEEAKAKDSPVSMLAHGGGEALRSGATRSAAVGPRATAHAAPVDAPEAPAAAAATSASAAGPRLAELEEHNVINEHGIVLAEVPEGTKASAFVLYDATHKAQYLGFSKDLRNTLRTLLCRRPELSYFFRSEHFAVADQAPLLKLRAAWIEELGDMPVGNKDPRQKSFWESPVDGGAMNERAYRTVAVGKAKQVMQQLKDRGLKEFIEFKDDLLDQGKVDPIPSALSVDDLFEQQQALSQNTSSVEIEACGKKVSFDLFYSTEFETKGGWWFDIEVSFDKQKSTHRVIVGRDFLAEVGSSNPREAVENAFAVLLAKKVPRKTEGIITSEVFPVNYFTTTHVATEFPEYLSLFGKRPEEFDWDRAQWNFKQVHDYSQDNKRTIPAGPMGGIFDPAALQ